jgi:hypothetical protein
MILLSGVHHLALEALALTTDRKKKCATVFLVSREGKYKGMIFSRNFACNIDLKLLLRT